MSLTDLTSRAKVNKLWAKVEANALRDFLAEIQADLVEQYENNLHKKSESIIAKLWEIQLEQGFNTLNEAIFYPTGTKYFYHTSQKTIVVIEQPPMVRTICYQPLGELGMMNAKRKRRYTIALPYVLFMFVYGHSHAADTTSLELCQCYFANGTLKSMDTPVAIAALPNLHESGTICWGTTQRHRDLGPDSSSFSTSSENLIKHIEESIAYFWGSVFNDDLNQHHLANTVENPGLAFDKWHSRTDKNTNVNFILKTKWFNSMPFKKMLLMVPGPDFPSTDQIPPNSFALANAQLDDVYCEMLHKSRLEAQRVMDEVRSSFACVALEECFHATVQAAAFKAHRAFLARLEATIDELPSYRRAEVRTCIEESLKAAMMTIK